MLAARRRRGRSLLALAVLVWAGTASRGAERFVDAAACPSTGRGTPEDPFCSIQDAVDASASGDLVRVRPGLYGSTSTRLIEVGGFPDTLEAVVFMKSGVQVQGSGAGASILDAGGSATVVVVERCGTGTLLSGFTLRGGGPGSLAGYDFGDGVFILEGAPRLEELEIQGLEGGLAAVDALGPAMPVLERVVIHDNGWTQPLQSAVLATEGASIQLLSSRVLRNHGLEAGGVFTTGGDALLVNCVIAGNSGARGGGVRLVSSAASTLSFSTVADNTSGTAGAGLRLESSAPLVTSCIIASNRSLSGGIGGVFADGGSLVRFEYTDVHGNVDTNYQSRLDPTGANGNISLDPRFQDLAVLDLRLRQGSPAIDSGSPSPPRFDVTRALRPLDGDRDESPAADMGSFEFDRWDVRSLRAHPEPFRLGWSAIPEASGYVVHRGTVEELASGSAGSCLTTGGDLVEPIHDDPADPPVKAAWFYLVAARVDAVIQTLGFDSRGRERIPPPGTSCP